MRKKLSLSLCLLTLMSSLAVAANGTLLIGTGAKSRAMGGIGIASFVGTDSALKNPAMLTANDGDQLSLSNTAIFEEARLTADGGINENYAPNVPLVPTIGYLKNMDENFVFAIHMAAIGGGAVDYGLDSNASFFQFKAEQAFVDTAFTLAHKYKNLSTGVSFIINQSTFETKTSVQGAQSYNPSTDLGLQVGLALEMGAHTLGFTYKSERSIYNKLSSGIGTSYYKQIPAEVGVGVSYNAGKFKMAADLKDILWSKSGVVGGSNTPTDGYAADGFDDQLVLALGAAYDMSEKLTLRVGFNYGESPISDAGLAAGTANKIHALSEEHLTAGLSYHASKNFAFDWAFTYASENSVSVPNGQAINTTPLTNLTYTKKQYSVTLGATIKF